MERAVLVHVNSPLNFIAENWPYIETRFPELQRVARTIGVVLGHEGWRRYRAEQVSDAMRRKALASLLAGKPASTVSVGAPYPTERGTDIWELLQGESASTAHLGEWRERSLEDLLRARAFLTHVVDRVGEALERSGREPASRTLGGLLDAAQGVEELRATTYMRDPPPYTCIVDGKPAKLDGEYDLLFWLRLMAGAAAHSIAPGRLAHVREAYVADVRNNLLASARLFSGSNAERAPPCVVWLAQGQTHLSADVLAVIDEAQTHYAAYLSIMQQLPMLPKNLAQLTLEAYPQRPAEAKNAVESKSP